MNNKTEFSDNRYLELYKYLSVLTEEQIIKLRKIATGILSLSAFTNEELNVLESKLSLQKG